ncbi:MAG: hypothetical protein WBC73_14245 [Phormidesmis sp.]
MFIFLQSIAKRITFVFIATILCLGLMQTSLQAAPLIKTEATETMSQESLSQMRAARREEQSKASQAANTEKESSSIGEKLNLEEIAEENPLTGNASKTPELNSPNQR